MPFGDGRGPWGGGPGRGLGYCPRNRGGDLLPGGLAEGKKPSDYDPKQIAMGIEVELEHTPDRDVAREIAMDHLEEIPDYYSRLKKMEDEAEGKINKKASAISVLTKWKKRRGSYNPVPHRAELLQFFFRDAPIKDKEVHAFADSLGVEHDLLEGEIYELLREVVRGGYGQEG